MKYHLTDFYFRLFVTLIPHPISIPKSEKCCNATVVQLQHYTCVKELFSTKMMPPQGGDIGKNANKSHFKDAWRVAEPVLSTSKDKTLGFSLIYNKLHHVPNTLL